MELSTIAANLINSIGPGKAIVSVKQQLFDLEIITTYNKVTRKLSRLGFYVMVNIIDFS